MQATKEKVVSINYTLTDDQGKVLDTSSGRGPLSYLHGAGNIIPGLENALEGKSVGDSLNVTVPPGEGYGERDPDLVQNVPRDRFPADANIEVGDQFQAQTPSGRQVVTVVDVQDDAVTVDANHPLAGQALHFDVTGGGPRRHGRRASSWARPWPRRSSPPLRVANNLVLACIAANRDFLSLDRRRAQRSNDVFRQTIRDFDQREPVGDEDGANLASADVRLSGNRADKVLRPHSRLPAGSDEQPRHARFRRGASAGAFAAFFHRSAACFGLPLARTPLRPGRRSGDLLLARFNARRLVGDLYRRQRQVDEVELVSERLDHDPIAVQIAGQGRLADRGAGQFQSSRAKIG
jgi:FKBP-type peptidyl-prolyl cis-trans isomerase SlyD